MSVGFNRFKLILGIINDTKTIKITNPLFWTKNSGLIYKTSISIKKLPGANSNKDKINTSFEKSINKIEPKRICFPVNREGKGKIFVLEGIKGGKSGMTMEAIFWECKKSV